VRLGAAFSESILGTPPLFLQDKIFINPLRPSAHNRAAADGLSNNMNSMSTTIRERILTACLSQRQGELSFRKSGTGNSWRFPLPAAKATETRPESSAMGKTTIVWSHLRSALARALSATHSAAYLPAYPGDRCSSIRRPTPLSASIFQLHLERFQFRLDAAEGAVTEPDDGGKHADPAKTADKLPNLEVVLQDAPLAEQNRPVPNVGIDER